MGTGCTPTAIALGHLVTSHDAHVGSKASTFNCLDQLWLCPEGQSPHKKCPSKLPGPHGVTSFRLSLSRQWKQHGWRGGVEVGYLCANNRILLQGPTQFAVSPAGARRPPDVNTTTQELFHNLISAQSITSNPIGFLVSGEAAQGTVSGPPLPAPPAPLSPVRILVSFSSFDRQ